VQFAPDDSPRDAPAISQDDRDRWRLREAYYAQRTHHLRRKEYTESAYALKIDGDDLDIEAFETGFEVILRREHAPDLVIREDGGIREIERK
jgi:hypothetical protein